MPRHAPAKPTSTEAVRIALNAEAAQAKDSFARLLAEYEGLVAHPDVIQEHAATVHSVTDDFELKGTLNG